MSDLMKIRLVKENGTPTLKDAGLLEVPALPRVGDHVSHDPSGTSGYVKSVSFWWPEEGGPLTIEVRLLR
jgi:hypothetical protein